ncbi:MAG TPA: type IV toxin-antitoxin system AbiEi family antitoxin [Myxococcales bacterium]|jgi:predicted transcriptional regulator of viral defense system|nr:type IV toxin-antitoxin system AbiEi family antitoxin [Myxococcales bacterium]
MKREHKSRSSLAGFVDALQGSGRYVLTRPEAIEALGVSDEALQAAVRRLAAKRRIVVPRRGFFVIVPVEYRSAGAPPPDWFIDDLMKFECQPYYVGLLSAAALHGAAHQQPQEFQVVTNAPLRPTRAGRARIRFFTKRHLERTPAIQVKTETGFMRVSTPEATAIDLVRYARSAGHLANVATVLGELAEKLDPGRLVEAARADVELSHVQRLGHLLDLVGAASIGEPLAAWLEAQRPRVIALRPGRALKTAARDSRWHVAINEQVEVDS